MTLGALGRIGLRPATVAALFVFSPSGAALVHAGVSNSPPKYVKTYAGPRQPRAAVALLTKMKPQVTIVDSIDGRTIENERACCLELLPGVHEIRVRYRVVHSSGGFSFSVEPLMVQFAAEAGRVYGLYPNDDHKLGVWSPSVADITSSTEKDEKNNATSLEEAFVEYRNAPAPDPPSLNNAAVLVCLQTVRLFSVDDVAKAASPKGLTSTMFKLSEGRHVLVAGLPSSSDGHLETLTQVEFTATTGHVYGLLPNVAGRFAPWAPCVIDITGELDNVKESLVVWINEFLKE